MVVGYIVQRRMEKMLKRQTAITISAIELTTCNLFQTYQLSVSLSDGWLGKWPRWKIVRKNCNKQLISQALSGMKTICWQTFSKPDNIFWPKSKMELEEERESFRFSWHALCSVLFCLYLAIVINPISKIDGVYTRRRLLSPQTATGE